MKKIILIFATTAAPLLFVSAAFCQEQQSFKSAGSASAFIASNDAKPPAGVSTTEADVINTRALRFFNKDFKNAEDIKWYKLKDGFVSYCRINGNKNRVFYDQKGNCAGSITYYNDKTMPKDLREIVKSVYYDYAITVVEEIHAAGKILFKVHIEDEKSWKIVDVTEGEITIVTDFSK